MPPKDADAPCDQHESRHQEELCVWFGTPKALFDGARVVAGLPITSTDHTIFIILHRDPGILTLAKDELRAPQSFQTGAGLFQTGGGLINLLIRGHCWEL